MWVLKNPGTRHSCLRAEMNELRLAEAGGYEAKTRMLGFRVEGD